MNNYKTDGGQWKIFLRIFLRILKIFFGGRWKGRKLNRLNRLKNLKRR